MGAALTAKTMCALVSRWYGGRSSATAIPTVILDIILSPPPFSKAKRKLFSPFFPARALPRPASTHRSAPSRRILPFRLAGRPVFISEAESHAKLHRRRARRRFGVQGDAPSADALSNDFMRHLENDDADDGAEHGPDEDVARVMHADIYTAERDECRRDKCERAFFSERAGQRRRAGKA